MHPSDAAWFLAQIWEYILDHFPLFEPTTAAAAVFSH